MSIENAVRNRAVLLEQIGQSALNARYPKEFELYVCALELVDEQGKTLRYFIFPVMPSNLEENQPKLTNIKKTAAGVTILSTTTFVPVDVNISGNFGRKFKVLLGTDYVEFLQSFSTQNGSVTADSLANGIVELFDSRVKTGYGCLKILEDIVNEADVVDENGARRLIFYNLAFGNSYVVKPMSFKIMMAQETNMIHGYSLALKGIAPLDALKSAQDLQDEAKQLNTTAFVQQKTDQIVNILTSVLAK